MKIRGIAHRGYSAKYPENTLSAFQAAIDLGFTHMELDVHLSKDGIPVVMHDHTVDRMTNGEGEIRHFTRKELQQLKINHHERIPTLEEVLHLAKNRIIVSIELKKTELYPNIEEKVYKTVHKMGMIEQVYFISFQHHSLVTLREISPDAQIGPLVNKVKRSNFSLMKKLKATHFAVRHDALKEKHVQKCEQMGIQPVVWTVDSTEDMKRMQQFPSVLITTNELERYKALCYPESNNDKGGEIDVFKQTNKKAKVG